MRCLLQWCLYRAASFSWERTTPDTKFADTGPGLREMMKAESPRVRVKVESFFIDKHEVTNEEFLRFVHEHPEYTSKNWAGGAQDP